MRASITIKPPSPSGAPRTTLYRYSRRTHGSKVLTLLHELLLLFTLAVMHQAKLEQFVT